MMILYMYIMQSDHHNKFVYHPSSHLGTHFFFFLVMGILRFTLLEIFWLYDAVLTLDTRLHIAPSSMCTGSF